jgi:hypothetical protein
MSSEIEAPVEAKKTFNEILVEINAKYLKLLEESYEKYKYHNELSGQMETELRSLVKKLSENNLYILYFLTTNYLYCLEPINDNNVDYFLYQKEKTVKKNGKVQKNKVTKFVGKVLFKKILKESDKFYNAKIFELIKELFVSLTEKDEDGRIVFMKEYVEYIKNNHNDDKNYSKMMIVIDNVDTILSNQAPAPVEDSKETSEKSKKSDKKKGKKSKENNFGFNKEFMDNLENTNIARLAKNISEKINTEDFPLLSDPTKLLSSLTGGGEGGEEGNIQNLLKFVVGEVETAFKDNNINEKELIGEAQGLMNQFQNMSGGFDPMSILKNMTGGNGQMPDLSQFESIFSNMKK